MEMDAQQLARSKQDMNVFKLGSHVHCSVEIIDVIQERNVTQEELQMDVQIHVL